MTRPAGYVIKPFDDTELKYSIEIALLRNDYADKLMKSSLVQEEYMQQAKKELEKIIQKII